MIGPTGLSVDFATIANKDAFLLRAADHAASEGAVTAAYLVHQ